MMMRKNSVVRISLILLLFICAKAQAQFHINKIEPVTIPPLSLPITYWKTTNLIFPYAIKSVDKGSKDVLVQIAKGVENILQVKAAKQGFTETNLSVVTAEGKFYSYILNYLENPPALNIKVGSNINYPKTDALFSYKTDNEARTYDITEQIAAKKPVISGLSDKQFDVKFSMDGLYIKNDKLYFQLSVENNSGVDYGIQALRFYIKDKTKSKRTASQEIEQLPVEYTGNVEIVRGKSKQVIVMAMDRFTIPDSKILYVELMEANGGRNLGFKVKNKNIVAAKNID